MSDTLMWMFCVVVFDVVSNTITQFLDAISRVDTCILTLDGSPEPLYPCVIQASAPSVHAHAYSLVSLFPCRTRVLNTLVGLMISGLP